MMQNTLTWIAQGQRGLWLALAALVPCVILGWVGHIGSDDATYMRGAYGWLEQFPYVGNHGTFRYPLTIPIALSFLAFGEGELTATLPSFLYLLAFLLFSWSVLKELAGSLAAFLAILLVVTCPLIAVQTSIVGIDIPETALLLSALYLLWHCLEKGADAWRLFFAGALVGVAYLARETAVFSVPFFAILFLIGYRFSRWRYLWIAAGFLAIWMVELIYFGVMTGDPLYRFNISLNHDSTIDRSIDLAGNMLIHPAIDPIFVLFINQEFMALMFFAIPLSAWLCFGRTIEPRLQHFARIFVLFAMCWWLCISVVMFLLPLNPRYFMVTSTIFCMLTGLGLAQLINSNTARTRLAGLLYIVFLIGTNVLGILVENKNPVFGERQLVAWLEEHPQQVVHTDPMTRYRAKFLLRWSDTAQRVIASPPSPGQLYYYNPQRSLEPNAYMTAQEQPSYQLHANWTKIATFHPQADGLAIVFEQTGIAKILPDSIWHKLRYRHAPSELYRIDEN